LPLQGNKVLDRKSRVSIINIFTDAMDDSDLHIQFDIVSFNYFAKAFNLTFSDCDIAELKNFTKSVTLQPNQASSVNFSIQVPFYLENKKEHFCKGEQSKSQKALTKAQHISSLQSQSYGF